MSEKCQIHCLKTKNLKENQNEDLRQRLLKDLEGKFNSLFEVRSMFILRKNELLRFILNESKFAKEYTQRFFHRYEFQNEVVLKFTYKGGVIKGAQNYFFKKVYIENKDFAPLLNKGTTHQSHKR